MKLTFRCVAVVAVVVVLGLAPSSPRVLRAAQPGATVTEFAAGLDECAVLVGNVEELYAAVNDDGHAGAVLVMAPGVYVLTALDPNGAARPNGGRLELQEDMSLVGAVGDRGAVVVDGGSLPRSSYVTEVSAGLPPSPTGAIRVGRGSNSVEWLTIRNARLAAAGIETDLLGTGPVSVRIAHIASTGNVRGIDVRNFGPSAAGRALEAQIVDNDLHDNTFGISEGLRIYNQSANRGTIRARLSGNRVYGQDSGLVMANNGSNLARVSVLSAGDRFVQNGAGVVILGGLGSIRTANDNAITFEARGTHFSDNNGHWVFDRGGLVVIGGENITIPNNASRNTVSVLLHGCRLEGNQDMDLAVIGARSAPASIGMPGTNNRVEVTLRGTALPSSVETAGSIPENPAWMNTAVIYR